MISVIIPARNERFLQKTISDLLAKAKGDIEVIAVLDGYWPPVQLVDHKNLVILHRGKPRGMRLGINDAAAMARGKYILKTDAHCMFDEGFDLKLIADCEKDWVVIPRRYRLDAEDWCINKDRQASIDHLYVCYPDNPNDFGGPTLTGREWRDYARKRNDILIDDLMTFQGSCWFMHRDYFFELDGLDNEKYGTFGKEPQEIGFKAWLSGGRVVRNKKTWYAHLHKGRKYGRGYSLGKSMLHKGGKAINQWLVFGKAWDKQTLDLKWLVDKFAPVPGWDKCDWEDEDWKRSLSE